MFLVTDFLENVLFLSLIQEIAILLLVISCRKAIWGFLQGAGKRAYLFLLSLVAVQVLLAAMTFHPFVPIPEAWEDLYSAKLLSQGDIPLFVRSFRHGTTWQVFLAQFFELFGYTPEIATWLNILAAVVAGLAIFHLSFALFRDRAACAAAAAVFVFSPVALDFTFIHKGKPMMAACLSALFLLCIVVSSRVSDWKLYGATLLTGAFLINLRQELGIYLLFLPAGLLLIRGRGAFAPEELRKWMAPAAAFLFFACIYYLHMERGLFAFYGEHFMGGAVYSAQTQCRECLSPLSARLPFLDNLGPAAFYAVCSVRRFLLILSYWFSGNGLFVLPVFLAPFLWLRKNKHMKEVVFLGLAFLLHTMVYAVHNGDPEERLLFQVYPVFCVITGLGVSMLLKALEQKGVKYSAWLLLPLAAFLYCRDLSRLVEYHPDYESVRRIDNRLSAMAHDKPLLILAGNLDERSKWRFLTDRQALSFQDLAPDADKRIFLDRDLTPDNAADYQLPMHFLRDWQVMTVSPRHERQAMEKIMLLSLRGRCRVRELFDEGEFTVSSVDDCRYDPDASYQADVGMVSMWLKAP